MTRKDACRLAERKKSEPLLIVEQRLELEAMDKLVEVLVPSVYASSAKSAISTVVDA